MPLFKVGDRVERIGADVPSWLRRGIITRVIPHKYGVQSATQYEVDFGGQVKEILYQIELRLVESTPPHD